MPVIEVSEPSLTVVLVCRVLRRVNGAPAGLLCLSGGLLELDLPAAAGL